MKSFILSDLELEGRVDSLFSTWTKLETLDLSQNRLKGPVPANWSPTLRTLLLDTNRLTGTVPESIYDLVNLDQLMLGENLLNGTISTAVGQLSNLGESTTNLSVLGTSSGQLLCLTISLHVIFHSNT